jgi:hypothetical protein
MRQRRRARALQPGSRKLATGGNASNPARVEYVTKRRRLCDPIIVRLLTKPQIGLVTFDGFTRDRLAGLGGGMPHSAHA